jgi:hypothetical protein
VVRAALIDGCSESGARVPRFGEMWGCPKRGDKKRSSGRREKSAAGVRRRPAAGTSGTSTVWGVRRRPASEDPIPGRVRCGERETLLQGRSRRSAENSNNAMSRLGTEERSNNIFFIFRKI